MILDRRDPSRRRSRTDPPPRGSRGLAGPSRGFAAAAARRCLPVTVVVVAVLGLLGGLWLVSPPSAVAQTTVWSGTLTTNQAFTDSRGCRSGIGVSSIACSALITSTNTFTYSGTSYEITGILLTDPAGNLILYLNKAIPNALTFNVGSSSFAVSAATLSTSSNIANSRAQWSSTGLSWSVGGTVSVSLTVPTATTTTTAATTTTTAATTTTTAATTTTTAATTTTTVAVSPGVVGDAAPVVPFGVVPHVTSPRAPAAPTLVAGEGQLGVSWAPPEAAGEPLVACWVLGYSDDDGRTWTTVPHPAPTLSGLKGGQRYLVRVAARVGGITGRWSPPAAATPTAAAPTAAAGPATPTTAPTPATPPPTDAATAPGDGDPPAAPEELTITPGPGRLEVSWTPPGDVGGAPLLGYAVEYSTTAGIFQRWPRPGATTGATTATISGLTGDVAHRVRVGAVGCDGVSDWTPTAAATPTVRPPQAPAAPTVPALVPGDGRLAVTWTPPADDGGTPLTGYTIEHSNDGGQTWTPQPHTSTRTATTIGGLLGDRPHRVRVSAVNTAGHGEPSPAATATPTVAPPDRPATPTITPGPRQLTITWTAPHHNGAPITAYTIEYSTDQGHTWTPWPHTTTHTTTTITDLTTGHPHQIRLTATNTAGTSPPTPPTMTTPH